MNALAASATLASTAGIVSSTLVRRLQHWPAVDLNAQVLQEISCLVGPEHVATGTADRLAHSHDRMPWSNFRLRADDLPATLAAAVVAPADSEQLARLVQLANVHGLRLIPYGAGSGVLGGTTPMSCEIVVDLKRMDAILSVDEINCTVTVQPGMNGGAFEAELNRRGYTSGHLPQSIHISTVGGWAACRGAGQASSRYGKVEDIVIGLKAVLPDGRPLEVRPVARRSVGPSIKDLMIGSEGVFGFITELTLRIWRQPEHEHGVVLAFPSRQAGFDALRETMQSELRPQVMRLYDEAESAQRTEGIAEFAARPILCILKFSGPQRLALVEEELTLAICARHGAVQATDDTPYRHWEESRYESYSVQWQERGYYMDTIEVAMPWRHLAAFYECAAAAVEAVDARFYFAAHWSHIYAEGACQYMTLRLPPMPHAEALPLHSRAWDAVQSACLALGGSVAHHHGAGIFRNRWLQRELNTGLDLLQVLKDGIDPQNLLNPGKLGLRPATGAMTIGVDGTAA